MYCRNALSQQPRSATKGHEAPFVAPYGHKANFSGGKNMNQKSNHESNIEYWDYCIDRANEATSDREALFFALSTMSKSLANIADSLKSIENSLESISDKATVKVSSEAERRQPPNNKRSDDYKKNIVDKCFESVAHDGVARFRDMCDSPLCEVADATLARYIRTFPKDYQFERGFVRRLT